MLSLAFALLPFLGLAFNSPIRRHANAALHSWRLAVDLHLAGVADSVAPSARKEDDNDDGRRSAVPGERQT